MGDDERTDLHAGDSEGDGGGDLDFRLMRQLFLQALQRPVDEQEAFVREACAGNDAVEANVLALLAAHGEMEGNATDSAAGPGDGEPDPIIGATIGDYRVLSLIARGGMGAVYRAEQEHPRREVALKLVDRYFATGELLRRFEVEAQFLARLKHPGIAQIHVAGTTGPALGSRPFFAMELVEGQSLTAFVEEHGLDQRAKLALLIKICAAIQHAHQVGVIHRDLKPANILVTAEGEPKILDFGIARSTDADLQVTTIGSGHPSLMGTLPYMSPEQVRGNPDELDTRADVHALGVLAYELLTGRLPRNVDGKSLTEAIRIIVNQEPSTLAKAGVGRFAADLETIVAKALASDRDERYASAAGLAGDLRRFLDGLPINARPPSFLYQLRKLVARNRLPAALFAGIMVVAVGSAVVMGVLANRIAGERDRANLALETANETSNFLESLILDTDPEQTLGREPTALDLLTRGAERMETELQDQPVVRGRLLGMLGKVYDSRGQPGRAEPLLEEAVRIGRRVRREMGEDEDRTNLALALPMLARCRRWQGRNDEAIALCRELREVCAAVYGTESQDYATALNHLGFHLASVPEHFAEAREVVREAYDLRERILGPDHADTGWSAFQYGWILRGAGENEEAKVEFERAYGIWQETLPATHPQLAVCLRDYAALLQELGKGDEAIAFAERALGIQKETLGTNHPAVAETLGVLGTTAWHKGDSPTALDYYRSAANVIEGSCGESDVRFVKNLFTVAFLHGELGQMEEREAVLRRALAVHRAHHAESPERLSKATGVLGEFLLAEGRPAEAKPLLRETCALLEQVGQREDRRRLSILDALVLALASEGDAEELLEVHRQRRALGNAHPEWTQPDPLQVRFKIGRQLSRLGRVGEAEEEPWFHLGAAAEHAAAGRMAEARASLESASTAGLSPADGRAAIENDPRLDAEVRRVLLELLTQ